MERCSPHGRQEAKRRKREGKGEKEGAREGRKERERGRDRQVSPSRAHIPPPKVSTMSNSTTS
jgi:hypothetical protein